MKSRSYPPSAATNDDWLEESWTVDCICGVNFDDGEEMVNCDECGVWVHTRCSRYVKSDKSFACDKCKSKINTNDSEETEVAKLLVELPTKTLRMDSPHKPSCHPRLPFKLWTDIPMDQRVHVQGVPGGEAGILSGFPSPVFTRDLWKCSGFVPKTFNFRFREFSRWDEGRDIRSATVEEHNENLVDVGAGALFSLSKEDTDAAHVRSFSGITGLLDKGGNQGVEPSKDLNKCEGDNINLRCPQDDTEKGRTLLPSSVFRLGKQRKEESGTSKDGGGKEVNVVNGDGVHKERAQQASTTVSPISSGTEHMVCNKDNGSKLIKADTHSVKIVESKETLPQNPLPDGPCILEIDADRPQENHSYGEHHPEGSAFVDPTFTLLNTECPLGEEAVHRLSPSIKSSPIDGLATSLKQHDPENDANTEEAVGVGCHNMNDNIGGFSASAESGPHISESLAGNISYAVTKGKGPNHRDLSVLIYPRSPEHPADMETESVLDDAVKNFNDESNTLGDTNSECRELFSRGSGVPRTRLSSNAKTDNRSEINILHYGLSVQGVSTMELSVKCQTARSDELPSNNPSHPKPQVEEPECPLAASSLEFGPDSSNTESRPKLSSVTEVPLARPKMESSSLQTNLISRPSASERKPFHDQLRSSSMKQGMSSVKIDDTSIDKNGEEMARKVLKERTKSSISSASKAPNLIKVSLDSDLKKPSSESKELRVCSSSRTPLALNTEGASASDEPASSLQTQSMSYLQNKTSISGLPQKGEKVNQTCTKMNHASQMHALAPSSSPAALSDEELALLLHQELNSSPRVPRVPRMRHAGSLPQLGSPTVPNMLTKRTCNSGARDHVVAGRKKNRELVRDGSHQETDDEVKMDMLAQSLDHMRENSKSVADSCCKREGISSVGKGIHAGKKSVPSISTVSLKSGPTSSSEANEPNEPNFSSMRCSIRDISDDDTGVICCPTRRTLPGLIAEIMSKGQRMTYEELCNAVLPHWPNLRKHNGERYAYSSHSQAVLDCLRNRHEWAQLVDRGPKTNAGRKRRKLDAEAPGPDSEDNVCATVKEAETKNRLESHQEDFPKGKRQARKRKRPALQGRGTKDIRRRRKTDINSDDDDGDAHSFSRSSEDDTMSDDETPRAGIFLDRSKASPSSDGLGIV